eukprot:TRINITY_DN1043_c7_g1_i1.p1 TRINITY_DN1043_c7_g1~~TRINITY_DN1043_c7_g1_i1.p1  ORF type:complete len:1503 (+),score=477.24 TRINITY_DN1043_c7_g1_i1:66-4511(+)
MELAARAELQLPPGHSVRDVRCVCFHPQVPSAYLALPGAIVEFDLVSGAELGGIPLRLPATHLFFVRERRAICACLTDGSVVVVSALDGHVLTEHRPSGAERRPYRCADIQAEGGGARSFLFAARARSSHVVGVELFSQHAKKPPVFSGHRASVNCLCCHPSLPLMACAALDGAVRVFNTGGGALLYNLIQPEKDREGAKPYVRIQFHADGIGGRGSTAAAKKKKKGIDAPAIYRDVRLLLVTERSLVTFYDVSMPGAPSKISDYSAPGSLFRDAHFHTLRRGVLFALDHRGLYLPLCCDPLAGEKQPQQAAMQFQGKKDGSKAKRLAAFRPNSQAFKHLNDYDNIRSLTLRVAGQARHGGGQIVSAIPNDEDPGSADIRAHHLTAHMHPSMPYFIFTGKDLSCSWGRSLTVHEMDAARCNGRGTLMPLVTQLRLPAAPDYWHGAQQQQQQQQPGESAQARVDGRLFSVALQGYSQLVVRSHRAGAPPGGGEQAEVAALIPLPVGQDKKPITHCIPLSLHHSPRRQLLLLSLLHMEGEWKKFSPAAPAHEVGTPVWCCMGDKQQRGAEQAFGPGQASCFLGPEDSHFVVVGDRGRRLERYQCGEGGGGATERPATIDLGALRLCAVFCGSLAPHCPEALLLQLTEASGRSAARLLPSWDAAAANPRASAALELDPDERVVEAAARDGEGGLLVGIATTRRVVICDPRFSVCATWAPPAGSPRLHSLTWIGLSLVFAQGESARLLTASGRVHRLAALPPLTAIAGALTDRLVLCSMDGADGAAVWGKHAAHFEALCLGALSLPTAPARRALLQRVAPRFDCTRCSAGTLQLLCNAGLADLAGRLAAEAGHGAQRSLLAARLAAHSTRDRPPGWDTQCRLQILGGDCAAGLETLRTALQRLRDSEGRICAAAPQRPHCLGPPYLAAACALFRAAVAQQKEAVVAQVLALCGDLRPLLLELRRSGDGAALHVAAAAAAADPRAQRLAAALAAELPQGSSRQPVPSAPRGARWEIGRAVSRQTVLVLGGGEEEELHPLPAGMRSYAWRPQPRRAGGTQVELHAGARGVETARRPAAADFGDKEGDSGSDDDGVAAAEGYADGGDDGDEGEDDVTEGQEGFRTADAKAAPAPRPAPAPGAAGGEEGEQDEDEIAQQQEELRRQYLASYAGYGDEDDHAAGDEDEGFGVRRKFKKFKIRTDAVVAPTPASLAGVKVGLAPMPVASSRRRRGQQAEDGPRGPGGAASPAPSAPDGGSVLSRPASPAVSPVELPPEYLGRSAQECIANGFKKLERGRFEEAEARMEAALTYLKMDADQLAQKTMLVQVAHYRVALRLLAKVKALERDQCDDDNPTLAHLTLLLTHLPLQRTHSVTCYKKAVKWNMEVGNYGAAKRCADHILTRHPEDADEDLAEQAATCADRGGQNQKMQDPRAAEEGVVFCWRDFTVLAASAEEDFECSRCTYCPAVYSPAAGAGGAQCMFCGYGQVP